MATKAKGETLQWVWLMVAVGIVLAVLWYRGKKVAPRVAVTGSVPGVQTGQSVWSTLIGKAGDVAISIFGKGTESSAPTVVVPETKLTLGNW